MDAKLLQILVCPVTKGPLIYNKTTNEVISASTTKTMTDFPIYDNSYQVGFNDTVNNATALNIEFSSNSPMTIKSLVYHFDYRRRR